MHLALTDFLQKEYRDTKQSLDTRGLQCQFVVSYRGQPIPFEQYGLRVSCLLRYGRTPLPLPEPDSRNPLFKLIKYVAGPLHGGTYTVQVHPYVEHRCAVIYM